MLLRVIIVIMIIKIERNVCEVRFQRRIEEMILALAGQLKQLSHTCTWSLKSPDHFLNSWSILLLFRNLICLSLYELLKSLRMFETGNVTTAGDEASSTTAYINIMYVNEMFPFLYLLTCRWSFR